MEEILENMRNWRDHQSNLVLMNSILSAVNNFNISYPSYDTSLNYHLYPGLECVLREGGLCRTYKMVMYMISAEKDTELYISNNLLSATNFIAKFDVINSVGAGGEVDYPESELSDAATAIPKVQATSRMSFWRNNINTWNVNNELFTVFVIPAQNFNFTNPSIRMKGYFGLKLENSNLLADIMICQINDNQQVEQYFDMSRAHPPLEISYFTESFALLDMIL